MYNFCIKYPYSQKKFPKDSELKLLQIAVDSQGQALVNWGLSQSSSLSSSWKTDTPKTEYKYSLKK